MTTFDSDHESAPVDADRNQAELHQRLVDLQHLEHGRRWARHLCLITLIMAALAITLAVCDYNMELATTARALGLLLILTTAIALFTRARRKCKYAAAQAAADIESSFPCYGQRLRTAFDYADHPRDTAPASPGLLKALNAETRQLSKGDDFRQASSPRSLYLSIAGCLLLFAGSALFLLAVPELRLTAGRMLLLPIDYTTVLLNQTNPPIAQGEDATIGIEVCGRPVREAVVRFRNAERKGDWTQVALLPAVANPDDSSMALHGKLVATINDCQHDLEVEILAGPRPLPSQRVRVLQPLEMDGFTASVQPPTYTGRDAETFASKSFSVWEGSLVDMQFEMNRPPARATLIPKAPTGSNQPAAVEQEISPIELEIKGNVATVQLPDIRRSLRFTLDAESADGMALDSPRYNIRVQLDKKPDIRFVSPDEELVVIPTTEIPLAIEAGDDLGVTKVGVLYKLSDGEMCALWEQDCAEPQDSLHVAKMLYLEDHQLTYHDAVTYYAFAEDRYFDQPRRVTTQLRFIDIRPFKRSFELTESPGGT